MRAAVVTLIVTAVIVACAPHGVIDCRSVGAIAARYVLRLDKKRHSAEWTSIVPARTGSIEEGDRHVTVTFPANEDEPFPVVLTIHEDSGRSSIAFANPALEAQNGPINCGPIEPLSDPM